MSDIRAINQKINELSEIKDALDNDVVQRLDIALRGNALLETGAVVILLALEKRLKIAQDDLDNAIAQLQSYNIVEEILAGPSND